VLGEAAEEADAVADPLFGVGEVDVAGGAARGDRLAGVGAGVGEVLENQGGASAHQQADEVAGVVGGLHALDAVGLGELAVVGEIEAGADPVSSMQLGWMPVSPRVR
jgi:hypothetical protein